MWNKYSRKKESCVRKKEVGKRCGSLSGICSGGHGWEFLFLGANIDAVSEGVNHIVKSRDNGKRQIKLKKLNICNGFMEKKAGYCMDC